MLIMITISISLIQCCFCDDRSDFSLAYEIDSEENASECLDDYARLIGANTNAPHLNNSISMSCYCQIRTDKRFKIFKSICPIG